MTDSSCTSSVVRRVMASVVGGFVDPDPRGSRDSSRRHTPLCEGEGGFEAQHPALIPGYLFRQAHRRAEVRVPTDDDGHIIPLLVCGLYEIQCETNVHPLLLSAGVYPPSIDVDSLISKVSQLIGPELVQYRPGCAIWDSCVEAGFRKGAARRHGDERLGRFLHIITCVVVWRCWPPAALR